MQNQLLAGTIAKVADLVDYQTGSIVSRQILKKDKGNVTLFAFDEGEALSEHTSPFDALVQVLDGQCEVIIAGQTHLLQAGDMILMPANHPHAVKAPKPFKMLLTMIRS